MSFNPLSIIKRPENRFLAVVLVLLITGGTLCWLAWQHPERLGLVAGSAVRDRWLLGLCVGTGMVLLTALMLFFSTRIAGKQNFEAARQRIKGDDIPAPVSASKEDYPQYGEFSHLRSHLRARYGLFWRYKVRLLMVVGGAADIDALVPTLAEKQWLEGQRTVLLHGGSLSDEVNKDRLAALRKLRRGRPLDGIVWAVNTEQSKSSHSFDNGLHTLQQMGKALRYQPPVYLWQLCDSPWSQAERVTQPVGVILPVKVMPDGVEQQLLSLLPLLCEQGLQQVSNMRQHDFLLRLGQSLEQGEAVRWKQVLTPWISEYAGRIPLRGLMFSLPQPAQSAVSGIHEHRWQMLPDWQGVTDDCVNARGKRVGLPWEQTLCYGLMALMLVWGAGSVMSFAVNRHQMVAAAKQAHSLVGSHDVSDEQLIALQLLRNGIGRLQTWEKDGAPWYQRFGLNHNPQLLTALWTWYGPASQRLIRDSAAQRLHQKLSQLADLPPASPERATLAKSGYDQLKAYLMMAHPEKAEGVFFSTTMQRTEPQRKGISLGLWQSIAPDLWTFYAENLPAHPDWKISPDRSLVSEVRQVLLGQIGRQNADNTVYQSILSSVRRNYADMRLEDMTADTDARQLFTTDEVIPGMFTRQAWEEAIQPAIEKAVATRRDEIDWVLSDNRKQLVGDASPEVRHQRLTERYFADFSAAWLNFLNGLRWNKTQTISDVTDQLTLVSDVRQSPLIALMNTLAWQGQTGRQDAGLSDSLLSSAKDLLTRKEDVPAIDQKAAGLIGPLDKTFGPLLALMGKRTASDNFSADSALSLQSWLTRVTRVRLKLQQVADAPEPQEMMQLLAQSVFQGKNVDLTDSQEYGNLIAANLGAEWRAFGQAMFVQPLKQSWQVVLEPTAVSLNDRWRNAIVKEWNAAFVGRYPFADSDSDASLSALADFIRQDSGLIDQFLTREMAGLLHKEGRHWVANNLNLQGLTVNPAFLKAVNQLGELSAILYPNGSQSIGFELRARSAPEVVETVLTIDGQVLHYFNQMESWQNFRWPGDTYQPATRLTWTSVDAGARLSGHYSGSWGFIRWLSQAKKQKLDASRWQLTVTAPDKLQLTWILRTERGEGPLALLKLAGFRLPEQIFDASKPQAMEVSPEISDEADTLIHDEDK
ncbi:ImcF-related family protein [Budvicia diplopodorum]|uniref:ImcF-related family protein n=1 Tax=Budvicia diplopodorum TaxID=1119056 RepID=UPI001FE2D465|nr:ImcF-related family protein [Budvicia diplopodorum]